MNKAKLKSYAPQARKDFIAAVTARANLLGLSEKAGKLDVATSQPQGDATLIAGQAWPIKVHSQRQQLITRIQKDGFTQTMEAVAYTWFNRFAALRYMELHDYLGHGQRALSGREGGLPDIVTHAIDLAQISVDDGGLPGLNPAQVVEMKLAGNRDGELYRMLLVAQCNALSTAMPFLFERIDDETELLLPDNLLRTDSVIAKLVDAIEEEDWAGVEIIGWLYQFYISEKKDEVIGKVVKSEDIPAATQLFTPNWIVQYMVQNSVGRLWLLANPASTLKSQWPYYIASADQALEVQAQLDALIQTRIDEDGNSLNPESITLLDPACGSGHILVEAYEVLKTIYLERGYQPRTIPRLILEKNLFGLDIDDRAAQMAGFALLMKARADDRRLFNEPVELNILSLQESKGLDAEELMRALQTVSGGVGGQIADGASSGGFVEDDLFPGTRPQFTLGESSEAYMVGDPVRQTIAALIDTFAHAKTFGSLIQIPSALNAQLAAVAERLQLAIQSGDLYAKAAAQDLLPLVAQARILAMQFDAVVANPPYMGAKFYGPELKYFVGQAYKKAKGDLYTCFMQRNTTFSKPGGLIAMITIPNWMFLPTFEDLRDWLFGESTIETLVHNGRGVFGSDFGSCAFTFRHFVMPEFNGHYKRLYDKQGSVASNEELDSRFKNSSSFFAAMKSFRKIPGSPIAFSIGVAALNIFDDFKRIGDYGSTGSGLQTSDNNRFLRQWYEINYLKFGKGYKSRLEAKNSGRKWFPHKKGGPFRKWYGNDDYVVNWENDGEELFSFATELYGSPTRIIKNTERYFQSGLTWSHTTSSFFSARMMEAGTIFNVEAPSLFDVEFELFLPFLCSKPCMFLIGITNPTLHFVSGSVAALPFDENKISSEKNRIRKIFNEAIEISKDDWNANEISWNFQKFPWLIAGLLSEAWKLWNEQCSDRFIRLKNLEEDNNRIFINAYGLQDELTPEVPESQITLARADREKDCQRLISYSIGCMMGRYSLEAPGLIYADTANVGFDDNRYGVFPADADGIVPLTDELWFEDDAAIRIREFLSAVWGVGNLPENIAWLAESLGIKAGETPDEAVRRYLADKFYKDHLQTYKRRPIYWLFSSGKQGAFQALVYLHRYHEGTLSRMRTEYVVPLTGKIQSRIDMLEKDAAVAASTGARNKLSKEVDRLKKKHVELLAYDELLRHHADRRITLDLDDGVKVNYGKFGDLLAEVKAVTGGASDDKP